MSKASKDNTKLLDGALLRAVKHMVACMERDTASYIQATELKAPLEKRLADFKRKHPGQLSQQLYEQREAVRSHWEKTGAGKEWDAAWKEFQVAASTSSKACTRVLTYKPKSLAGAAYVALAAIGRYNTTGPGYGFADECSLLIVLMLFEAAGLRLSPAVRRAMKKDEATAAMLRRFAV